MTTECSGVQKGSARSLQVVGGVLYYLSGDGVQAFDGSLPVCVSQALGAERYHGGGHACASGATVYSPEEMQALVAETLSCRIPITFSVSETACLINRPATIFPALHRRQPL